MAEREAHADLIRLAKPAHVLIVEARYYRRIADELAESAIDVLRRAGATHDRLAVPGTFEIPAAIGFAARSTVKRYDGYVALGCVIRGQTTHYDYVCAESARGLQTLAIERGLPIGYGILTVENMKQAKARAAATGEDRGGAAARACVAMIALRREMAPP
jgi:6,7-dimethyl-8-ribityllumazine synthase